MNNEIQSIEQRSDMESLYSSIRSILDNARKRAYSAVNFAMVESYWKIGQSIVEHEQHGEARADYGKGLLKELAARLTQELERALMNESCGRCASFIRHLRFGTHCVPN